MKKKFKDFDTDYNSFIKFNLEEFTDLNILEILNKIEREEKNQFKFEFGYEEINNKKGNFIDINDIDDNIDDEEINNQSKVFNFFPLPSNDKEKENEEEKKIFEKERQLLLEEERKKLKEERKKIIEEERIKAEEEIKRKRRNKKLI